MSSESVFRYASSINNGETILVESDYNKFLTTRAFSYHLDTLIVANELNMYPKMDDQQHYDFLRAMIRPKKRFSKWPKPQKHREASLLSKYLKIRMVEAYSLVSLFSEEQYAELEEHFKDVK